MIQSRFLLKVENEIYGYDDTNILLIHMMQNKELEYSIFLIQTNCLVIKYKEINIDKLKKMNKLER